MSTKMAQKLQLEHVRLYHTGKTYTKLCCVMSPGKRHAARANSEQRWPAVAILEERWPAGSHAVSATGAAQSAAGALSPPSTASEQHKIPLSL